MALYDDITVEDYKARFKDSDTPHLLLDVRTPEEFAEARIPGSVNIPLDELTARVEDVSSAASGQPVVLVCRTGARSAMGAQFLRMVGLNNLELYNLDTGVVGWAQQRLPLDRD